MHNSISAHSGRREPMRAAHKCGCVCDDRACAPAAPWARRPAPAGSTGSWEPVWACVGSAPLVRPRAPAEAGVRCEERPRRRGPASACLPACHAMRPVSALRRRAWRLRPRRALRRRRSPQRRPCKSAQRRPRKSPRRRRRSASARACGAPSASARRASRRGAHGGGFAAIQFWETGSPARRGCRESCSDACRAALQARHCSPHALLAACTARRARPCR